MGPSAALKTTYANGRKTVAPTSNASSMLTAPVARPQSHDRRGYREPDAAERRGDGSTRY